MRPILPPRAVTIAAGVQYATAGLALAGAVLSILIAQKLAAVLPGALAEEFPTEAQRETAVFTTRAASYGVIGLWLLCSLVFASFARFYRRGSRWARNWTWAVAGPLVLCGVCGFASAGSPKSYGENPATSERIEQALDAATPSWWSGTNAMVQALTFASYLAIIVLLATPAANAWFREARVASGEPAPVA
ncbi:hypothetical protein [Phytomonospora endophytica]|uniref:Uncharacterized protein n=1 Tax=Phytomonospora endophytica TaxID=714109 RepID=A0A841G2V6_9ACTN|nr:hypothetical protein [Phytomonospora endophytica]MBB6039967.1 hypothetical protein [Phytomonospora endophytica]GIG69827.1 hypothetical protein Pen01_61220 [Phytomonospora endophytica]